MPGLELTPTTLLMLTNFSVAIVSFFAVAQSHRILKSQDLRLIFFGLGSIIPFLALLIISSTLPWGVNPEFSFQILFLIVNTLLVYTVLRIREFTKKFSFV